MIYLVNVTAIGQAKPWRAPYAGVGVQVTPQPPGRCVAWDQRLPMRMRISFHAGKVGIIFIPNSPGCGAPLVPQRIKSLPAMWGTQVRSLGQEDPLEKEMATHSSILAWRIPMDRGAWWATVHRVAKSWI